MVEFYLPVPLLNITWIGIPEAASDKESEDDDSLGRPKKVGWMVSWKTLTCL